MKWVKFNDEMREKDVCAMLQEFWKIVNRKAMRNKKRVKIKLLAGLSVEGIKRKRNGCV